MLEATTDQVQASLNQTSSEFRALESCARATSFLSNSCSQILNSILMVMIDYKGFRILAHADTNTKQANLKYL